MLTLELDANEGTLKAYAEHTDPSYAKMMMDYYLIELSDSLREEKLGNVKENQKLLRAQIENTPDALLKEEIYTLLAKEIENEALTRSQNPYGFQILDSPIVPNPGENLKPNRSLICILAVLVSFLMAVLLALLMEYVHNVRNGNPERLLRFRDSLRLKKKTNASA